MSRRGAQGPRVASSTQMRRQLNRRPLCVFLAYLLV